MINAVISQPVNPWTPPEYFPTKAVLIEWDFNQNIWNLYSELISECREVTEVILVVRNQTEENQMTQQLISDGVSMSGISFVHVPCERMWIRDHGPISVMTDSGAVFIDLDDLANSGMDEDLPVNLANAWGIDSYQLPYVFCGGNFMVDSYNTLFTTQRVYSQNTSYTPQAIAQDFQTYMGITGIVTLSEQHDDYWGHIDMQIKLLDDTTFVISSVSPGSGPNYDSLGTNFTYLSSLTAPNGKPYRIARLPMADDWKTYANSLILNNKVLVPTYNHALDSAALQIYQDLLPGYEIEGINCNQIIGWEGAIHCITMQLFDESQVTAIHDLSVRDNIFKVYPNPATQGQLLHILLSEDNVENAVISFYDINGKMLMSEVREKGGMYSFRCPFPSGTYIAEVKISGSRYSEIFIVK